MNKFQCAYAFYEINLSTLIIDLTYHRIPMFIVFTLHLRMKVTIQ